MQCSGEMFRCVYKQLSAGHLSELFETYLAGETLDGFNSAPSSPSLQPSGSDNTIVEKYTSLERKPGYAPITGTMHIADIVQIHPCAFTMRFLSSSHLTFYETCRQGLSLTGRLQVGMYLLSRPRTRYHDELLHAACELHTWPELRY